MQSPHDDIRAEAQQPDQEETTINLLPYFLALLRRWRIIAISTIVPMILVLLYNIAFVAPTLDYRATSDVLLVFKQAELSLVPGFVTAAGSEGLNTGNTNQRDAVIALAQSGSLEERVWDQIPPEMQEHITEDYQPGTVQAQIQVNTEGDLVQITARAKTPEAALMLARTWSTAYVNLINVLYSNRNDDLVQELENQIEEAQINLNQLQQRVDQLAGDVELVRANQRIIVLENLLNASGESNLELYRQYLIEYRRLDRILGHMHILQEQSQQSDIGNLANSLNMLALQNQVFAGATTSQSSPSQSSPVVIPTLPFQVHLQEIGPIIGTNREAMTEHLERMIVVVEDQRNEQLALAEQVAQAMKRGEFVNAGLPPALQEEYEAELAELRGMVEQMTAQTNLAIQQRDTALGYLKLLEDKNNEQRIAQSLPETIVRLVGFSVEPQQFVREIATSAVIVGVLGFLLSTGTILFLEIRKTILPLMDDQ